MHRHAKDNEVRALAKALYWHEKVQGAAEVWGDNDREREENILAHLEEECKVVIIDETYKKEALVLTDNGAYVVTHFEWVPIVAGSNELMLSQEMKDFIGIQD